METINLYLRRFTLNDFTDFHNLIIDKMNSPYALYDEQFPTDSKSVKAILEYFCTTDEFMAVELKEEKQVIGFIALNYIDDTTRNVGYTLHSKYQHRGYGTEMLKAIIKYAKDELLVNKLVAGSAEENIPSCHLLEKIGFVLIKKEKASFTNDQDNNLVIFTGCLYEYIFKG